MDHEQRSAEALARRPMTEALAVRRRAGAGPTRAYRVLARKYRPSTLRGPHRPGADGAHARKTPSILNRIHQAYLLTGVRGVGKTTTARILARAFNYELPAARRPARDR